MNRRLLRVLLALYPRAWRDRYGAEIAELSEELIAAGETTPLHGALNLVAGAAAVRWCALARSRRLSLAMAVVVIAAVAGSMFGASRVGPEPVPAGLDSARCVLRQEAGPVMFLPSGADRGQVSRALTRLRIAAHRDRARESRCLVLPALCRVRPGKAGKAGKAYVPGRVEPGQCVVAPPMWCRIAAGDAPARAGGPGRPAVRACPAPWLSS